MIEVFKTNVINREHAKALVRHITETFKGYKANFDLEDCDKILRVVNPQGIIDGQMIIGLLKEAGFDAEVLPGDDLQFVDYPKYHFSP